MRWPFVSGSTYDTAVEEIRELHQHLQDTRARLAEAQRLAAAVMGQVTKLCDTMLANYQELRVSGANLPPPPPPQPRTPLPVPARDEIADAVELSAGNDAALARHLSRWAKQQRLDGMKEHDIIQSIIHWRSATEWDGSAEDVPSFL